VFPKTKVQLKGQKFKNITDNKAESQTVHETGITEILSAVREVLAPTTWYNTNL